MSQAIFSNRIVIFANAQSKQNRLAMSEKELNAYRFSSEEEPSDEMLEQIMKEVAEEANAGNQKAAEEHFAQMRQDIANKQSKWGDKINSVIHE